MHVVDECIHVSYTSYWKGVEADYTCTIDADVMSHAQDEDSTKA